MQREIAALIEQTTNNAVAVVGRQDRQAHIDLALPVFQAQAPVLRLERVGFQPGMGFEVARNALQRLHRQRGNAPHHAVNAKADGATANKGVDVNVRRIAVNGGAQNCVDQLHCIAVGPDALRQQVDDARLDASAAQRLGKQSSLTSIYVLRRHHHQLHLPFGGKTQLLVLVLRQARIGHSNAGQVALLPQWCQAHLAAHALGQATCVSGLKALHVARLQPVSLPDKGGQLLSTDVEQAANLRPGIAQVRGNVYVWGHKHLRVTTLGGIKQPMHRCVHGLVPRSYFLPTGWTLSFSVWLS